MKIEFNISALRGTRAHEHLLRFGLGGLATVCAGLIAKRFGPITGGLFLAFPAIFPAAATMLEKHEKEKKEKVGSDGSRRGREAAALDALGATLGSIGLCAFALMMWRYLPLHSSGLTFSLAMGAWLVISGSLWLLRKQA
ncbi:MAG TPA: DUF3147 family protein [Acidisarcina sp.]